MYQIWNARSLYRIESHTTIKICNGFFTFFNHIICKKMILLKQEARTCHRKCLSLPGESLMYKQPFLSGSDLDIFFVGFRRDFTLLVSLPERTGSGTSKILPYLELKALHNLRHVSTFCRLSSPTGILESINWFHFFGIAQKNCFDYLVPLYSKISADWRTG